MSTTETETTQRPEEEVLAELQRKAESRRQQAQATAPGESAPTTTSEARFIDRAFRCWKCDRRWTTSWPTLTGKPVPETGTICEECESKATAAEEAHRRALEKEARERIRKAREERILELLHAAGVNVWDLGSATLENFRTDQSGRAPLGATLEFLHVLRTAGPYQPVRGLYLFGETGAGKSHLAAAVARELLLDPKIDEGSVIFDHALRLIGRIQSTYSSHERSDEIIDRRINTGCWILDDLGSEAPSADVARRLTEIFTERAMRPMLVTSNLPPHQLEDRNPELFRVVSRLGPRYFRVVEVKGSDRRYEYAP